MCSRAGAARGPNPVEQSMPEASGDDRTVILFSPRNRDTPEQRAAQAFQARSVSSDWLDERWASIHLPWIRLAAGVLGKNDSELEAAICKLSFLERKDDPLSTLFKRWREATRARRDAASVGRSDESMSKRA